MRCHKHLCQSSGRVGYGKVDMLEITHEKSWSIFNSVSNVTVAMVSAVRLILRLSVIEDYIHETEENKVFSCFLINALNLEYCFSRMYIMSSRTPSMKRKRGSNWKVD